MFKSLINKLGCKINISNISNRCLIRCSLVVLFFIFFTPTNSVWAESTTSAQDDFMQFVLLIVHMIVYLSWLMLGIMGPLLSNDLLMHPNVIPLLKLLWTVIRNLVNLIFVAVFIWEGFKAIFEFNQDDPSSNIKKTVMEAAIALILVNFSFSMVTVIVDASTVATRSAFALTSMMSTGDKFLCTEDKKKDGTCFKIPYSIKYNTKAETAMKQKCTGANCPDAKMQDWAKLIYFSKAGSTMDEAMEKKLNYLDEKKEKDWRCITGKTCSTAEYLKELKERALIHVEVKDYTKDIAIDSNNIVPVIAQNLLPLETLLVNNNADNAGVLVIKILFSAIMSLAMLLAFIALAAVLLVRVVVLWIAFIISPLVVFAIYDFLGLKGKLKMDEFVGTVIKHAFAPALFGLVLSLTVVVIGQLQFTDYEAFYKGGQALYFDQSVLSNTHPLFGLLLMMLVVVAFWKGIFWALDETWARGVTDGIQGGVKGAGEFVKKTFMNANWIPAYTGGASGVDAKTSPNQIFKDVMGGVQGAANQFLGVDSHDEELDKARRELKITSKPGLAAFDKIKSDKQIVNNSINNIKNTQPQLISNFNTDIKNGEFDSNSVKTVMEQLGQKIVGSEAWKKLDPNEKASLHVQMMEQIKPEILEKEKKSLYSTVIKAMKKNDGATITAIDRLNSSLSNKDVKIDENVLKNIGIEMKDLDRDGSKFNKLVANLNKIIEKKNMRNPDDLTTFLKEEQKNSNSNIIKALIESKDVPL